MKKKLTAVALAAGMCVAGLGLAACGPKKGENELWITYYRGGYGEEWVQTLAQKFGEEYGVNVRADADTQLIAAVPNMMENGTEYDLIFCHDVAWEDFVAPGWIYCLDDLYETEVEYNGQNVKFKDRIWDEDVLASASYPDREGKLHYYKVPWTIGTAGIAYSLKVMQRVDDWLAGSKGQAYLATQEGHLRGEVDLNRRWNQTPPQDYYDLLQYCFDIEAAKLEVNEEAAADEKVKPFTWSGSEEEWQWDYVLFDWWGQLAGPETMNMFKNFGNVKSKEDLTYDINERKNPNREVFNPANNAVVKNEDGTVNKEDSTYIGWGEFEDAYRLWYNLVVSHKDWSLKSTAGLSKFDNENAFAAGKAAMTPAACWVEYETKYYLDKTDNVISLMPTPTVSNVKFDAQGNLIMPYEFDTKTADLTLDAIHADAGATEKVIEVNGIKYNRVSFTSSFGDSAMIPAKSSGRDLAVQFLLFMQREENAQLFTKLSGGTILPYKYDYANSFVEDGVDKASAWQKSIFEIDQNSTKFNNYTQHAMMRSTGLKGSARMTSVWPRNNYYYVKAWINSTDSTYKPENLISKTIYNGTIVQLWDTYKKAIV